MPKKPDYQQRCPGISLIHDDLLIYLSCARSALDCPGRSTLQFVSASPLLSHPHSPCISCTQVLLKCTPAVHEFHDFIFSWHEWRSSDTLSSLVFIDD